MPALLRATALVLALLSSGGAQAVAVAMADEACCPDEAGMGDVPGTDCPLGFACECCAATRVLPVDRAGAPVAASIAVAVPVAAREPVLGSPSADIFHPPRA